MDVIRRLRELHEATTGDRWEEAGEWSVRTDDGRLVLDTAREPDAEWVAEAHRVWPALLAVAAAAERVRRCEHYWMVDGNCLRVRLSAEERCGPCRVRTALSGLRDAAGAATEGAQQ
jgi:hypothetical protein